MSKVFLAAAGDITWTNVIVQARIKILSFNGSSTSYYAGLCARVQDANNYYCVTLRSNGSVSIRGDIGGSSNSIGSSNSYGVVTGTWYTVQLADRRQHHHGPPSTERRCSPRAAIPPSPTRR